MKHAMIEKSSAANIAIAEECADWLIDAIACATQDRYFLRGDDKCDTFTTNAIITIGVIACLRAIRASNTTDNGGAA